MPEYLSKLIAAAKELCRDDKQFGELAALAETELQVLLCAAKLPATPEIEGGVTYDAKATILKGLSDICLLTSKATTGLSKPLLEARQLSVELYTIASGMNCREVNKGHPSFSEMSGNLTTTA